MAYTLDYSLALGSSKTGLTLVAQLVTTAGANSGAAITTGFSEIGTGNYLWHYAAFADDFRGGVKFYEDGVPATILAFAAINPEEVENADVKTSTRSDGTEVTLSAAAVTAIDTELSAEHGSGAWTDSAGAGATEFVYTVTDDVSGDAIADVHVWVTTDISGDTLVASGYTDDFGDVTFFLDVGTYYFWRKKSGYDFTNPDTEVVT